MVDHDFFKLCEDDPAHHGMTDFTRKAVISVTAERPIDEALAEMRRFGLRALFVTRGDEVVGLITSYDIEGACRERVRVVDVMTEWDDVPTVCWRTMQSACIADLLEILRGVGVMHLVVVEDDAHGKPILRGLVSRARIETRLARRRATYAAGSEASVS